MSQDTGNAIAASVRAELARRRISQTDAGEVIGLGQRALSRRLSGEVEFSASELQRLADMLEVPVASLYGVPA